MVESLPFPALTCPICHHTEFKPGTTGLLIKKPIYTCATCGTSLEAHGRGEQLVYTVHGIGPQYTNGAATLGQVQWTPGELGSGDIQIYSDAQLAEFVQGNLPAEILALPDAAPPFELEDGEQAVFILENVLIFEERLWGGSSGTRFSFRETIGRWQTVGSLVDPRRRDVMDTLDEGMLSITDRRYQFTALQRHIDEPFSKIASVIPFRDGMKIVRSNATKTENYKGGYHWPLVAAVLRGLIRRSSTTKSD